MKRKALTKRAKRIKPKRVLNRYWLSTFSAEFRLLCNNDKNEPALNKVDKKLAREFANSLGGFYIARGLRPKQAARAEYEHQLSYGDHLSG